MLDRLIGFVIGDFEFAIRPVIGMGLVVEATVGDWPAEALVEEEEQERDLNSFDSEPVGIATAVAFEQAMSLQLTQIIAELVESIGIRGKLKAGE